MTLVPEVIGTRGYFSLHAHENCQEGNVFCKRKQQFVKPNCPAVDTVLGGLLAL